MSEPFTYLSLLIVFLIFFYDILSKEVNELLIKGIDKEGSVRKMYRRHLIIISFKVGSLTLFYSVITWVLLPEWFNIWGNSSVSLWEFDIKTTLLFYLEFLLLVFTYLSFELCSKIIGRWKIYIKRGKRAS